MSQEAMVIRCLNCGTKNRIPRERMGKLPICGRCHSHLDDMIIRCLNCGKKNRMPETRLHEQPLCGECGAPLVVGAKFSPVDISDATFMGEVLSCRGAVLVDCWAPWCAPCRLLSPILDDLASKYAGGAKVAKLNVDENPLTASQYEIHSIPTMLFFKDGSLASRLVGVKTKEEIERNLLAIMKTN